MSVSVCLSVTTLAATSFVLTLEVRYVAVYYRLFLDIKPLWREKANMLMTLSICLPRPPMVLMQRHFVRLFEDRAFSGSFKV